MAATAEHQIEHPPSSLLEASPLRPSQVAAVVAILLLATVPFLNKAIHIDDVLYLRVAEQIRRTPWDPLRGAVLWDAEDGLPASLFDTNYNPPLWNYVLAGALGTFAQDRAEWKLHLVESLAVWLAGFAVFQLSRRFSRHPVWCTGLIFWGPFFLPGQNLMLEAPMLALWCWSLEFAVRAWRTNRWRWILLAGAGLSAAVMTKYTAGLLLPLLVLGSLWHRRPKGLWMAALPVLTVLAWTAHCIWFHGQPHLGSQRFQLGWEEIPLRILTVVRCVGAVTIFGPIVALVLWRAGAAARLWLVALSVGAVLLAWMDLLRIVERVTLMFQWHLSNLMMAHYLVFSFHGAVILLGAVGVACSRWFSGRRTLRTLDAEGFLECWIAGLLAFNVLCVPFNAIRHLLIGLVPAVWWMSIQLHRCGDSTWLRRAMFTCSTVLGFALAWGDYEFAGVYRDVAQKKVLPFAATGAPVWFTGTWGFAYYASQAGGNPLVQQPERFGLPPIGRGQKIFNPMLLNWKPFPPDFLPEVAALDHLQPPAASFVRTIAPGVHYYSTLDYALPWELLIQPAHEDEPEAIYELPPVDDILIFQVVGDR